MSEPEEDGTYCPICGEPMILSEFGYKCVRCKEQEDA